MLRLEMLSADQGDCLWLEYGDRARPHRALNDGGTPATYRGLGRPGPEATAQLRDSPPAGLGLVFEVD